MFSFLCVRFCEGFLCQVAYTELLGIFFISVNMKPEINNALPTHTHICIRLPEKKPRQSQSTARPKATARAKAPTVEASEGAWLEDALGDAMEQAARRDLSRAVGEDCDGDDVDEDVDIEHGVDGVEDPHMLELDEDGLGYSCNAPEDERPLDQDVFDEVFDLAERGELGDAFDLPEVPLPRLMPSDSVVLREVKDIVLSRCKVALDALHLAQRGADSTARSSDAVRLPPEEGKLSLVVHQELVSVVLWTQPNNWMGRVISIDGAGKMKGFVPFRCKPRSFEGCRFVVHNVGVSHFQSRMHQVDMPQWVLLLKRHAEAQLFPGPLEWKRENVCLLCHCVSGCSESRLVVDSADGIYQCMECTCFWHLGCAKLATYTWRQSEDVVRIHAGKTFRCSVCLPA